MLIDKIAIKLFKQLMRKIYFLAFFIAGVMLSSCGRGGAGELVGAYNKKFKNKTIPLGMVYIPGGRNLIGMTDEDITFYQGRQSKMVSFSPFYMDETEITNAEYRQFVNWVRDSIAVSVYVKGAPYEGGGNYKTPSGDAAKYFLKPKTQPASGTTAPPQNINWKAIGNGSKLWANNKGGNKDLGDLYSKISMNGRDISVGLDVKKLKYSYYEVNLEYQLKNPNGSIADFYDVYVDNPDPNNPNQHPSVMVYPDTLVWKKDFTYEYNDPMVEAYFNHPSYDRYPVVGVTWDQAKAFCAWRTNLYESVASKRKLPKNTRLKYSLPTESEFEYAARGGRVQTKYPWGGPYIMNAKGCLQANFKVGRGNYVDDGALYTVEAKAYLPNDYGLYNMAGNVAEWTLDSYNTSSPEDKNPIFRNGKRKAVKGGSWKDIGFFLQNSVTQYEYQDMARSYIGFRCISKFPGNKI